MCCGSPILPPGELRISIPGTNIESTFWVKLLLPHGGQVSLINALEGAVGCHVLIVDDEGAVRKLVRMVLSTAGYESLEAEDGQAAYELLQNLETAPKLVITDIRMPRMNGAELCERLRMEYPDTKILCISAYSDPLSPNGHYFLAKPFTSKALLAMVKDVLELPAPGEIRRP